MSECWLDQTFSPRHPSSFQKSPFVLYSIRDGFPPFSLCSPFSFRHFTLFLRTSSTGRAVSQSLYPSSPRVASPRRFEHMLFCLAQVSRIPDIIGRTPVSLADSHLDQGGQSLCRQWWTCPRCQVQSTHIKGPRHISFGLGEAIVISCWIRQRSHSLCHIAHVQSRTHTLPFLLQNVCWIFKLKFHFFNYSCCLPFLFHFPQSAKLWIMI